MYITNELTRTLVQREQVKSKNENKLDLFLHDMITGDGFIKASKWPFIKMTHGYEKELALVKAQIKWTELQKQFDLAHPFNLKNKF
jgi:hypothetical protein